MLDDAPRERIGRLGKHRVKAIGFQRPAFLEIQWLAQAIEQAGVPLVLSVYLDRPAILTEVAPAARVLLANFGALDQALFDVMSGTQKARGKLPFELPSSWQAVQNQHPDVAKDSANPLYPYGAGLADKTEILALNKTDANDAEAICEAVTRPTMRYAHCAWRANSSMATSSLS